MGEGNCAEVNLNLPGAFNIYNALAAAAVGQFFNIELRDIKTGLESFKGVPMRLEIKELFGATVISDVYNANPSSMEEAIKELVRLKKGRAIAVLGDMLELGAYAEEAHRKNRRVDVSASDRRIYRCRAFDGYNTFRVCQNRKAVIQCLYFGRSRKDTDRAVQGRRHNRCEGFKGMGMEKVLEINPVRDVSLNGVNKEAENAL